MVLEPTGVPSVPYSISHPKALVDLDAFRLNDTLEMMELVRIDLRGRQVRLGKFVYASLFWGLPEVAKQIEAKLLEPPKKRIPKIPDRFTRFKKRLGR
jgi:hypothetical protein